MFATEANAILMVDLSNYEAHKALSANPAYQFTAFIQVTTPSGSKVSSSGIAIAPNLILVAAHGIPSPTNQSLVTTVSIGPNVFAEEAQSFKIRSWQRYPGYVPGDGNTLDFGLVHLDEFIPEFQPVTFGSASVDQMLTVVGYGRFAEMYATDSSSSLGDRLAGFAPVSSSVSTPYSGQLYFSTFFSLNSTISSLRAMAISGDSGGPCFNADGHIVGIHTAASNGFDGGFGTALRTSNPDFLDYVSPRIATSWAEFYAQRQPEIMNVSIQPSTLNLPPKFSGTVANGPPMGTARLQASLDLGATDPWADLVSVTLDSEGSATFTNIPDSRPLALGAHSDYFRVVTEPPSIP